MSNTPIVPSSPASVASAATVATKTSKATVTSLGKPTTSQFSLINIITEYGTYIAIGVALIAILLSYMNWKNSDASIEKRLSILENQVHQLSSDVSVLQNEKEQ